LHRERVYAQAFAQSFPQRNRSHTTPEMNITVNYEKAIRESGLACEDGREVAPFGAKFAETNLSIRIMEMEINWSLLEKLWAHIEPFFAKDMQKKKPEN
jgi:hypothetical protein